MKKRGIIPPSEMEGEEKKKRRDPMFFQSADGLRGRARQKVPGKIQKTPRLKTREEKKEERKGR